ncbi:hypothetical protein COHA_004642 [Chlorella ohadii]|uniref:Major facilitator superfamily (MFS) profile domain-containing protein n=1 Tax=Chlorella ohadii TaxID=2649997 RepID=A0AAD5H761_9CHLO|nr:hypothetical protein COHA_004642 [Chlorella ohadii]
MLWLVAAFASIAGFLFGYDLGLIGGALLNIRDALGIGDWAAEAIVAAAKFGAVPGTFLGGALMLHYGRRAAIGIDSLFFIAGPLIMALALGVGGLIAGRVVVGLGIGISAAVVPAYLGEVAPARVRGRVVESYEILLCAGMLAASLGDAAFQGLPSNWRWMVGAPIVPALLLSLSMCLLPESPRWLVIRGRLDEALAVIHRVYTHKILPAGMQHSTAEVEHELLQLWSSVEKDRDAAAARRQAHAQRRRRRAEAARTKLAPISSSPVGLGSSRAGAGSSGDGKGSWQRLWPGEEEGEEGRAAAVRHAPAGDDMPAGEAGVAAAATEAGGFAASERRSLLPGGGGSEQEAAGSPLAVPPHLPRIRTSSAASLQLLEQQGQQGQQQAGQHPLQPLEQAQQPQQAQQQRAQHEVELQSSIGAGRSAATAAWPSSREAPHDVEAGAAAEQDEDEQEEAGESTYLAGEWGTGSRTASQQLERLASGLRQQRSLNGQQLERLAEEGGTAGQQQAAAAGAGAVSLQEGAAAAAAGAGKEPSFWSTLREMLLDIRLVASGPERQALQVLERAGVESHTAATLLTSAVGGSKMLGVLLSFFLVDSLGRRPLLVWGSVGCAAALGALCLADWLALKAFLVAGMCAFIFAFRWDAGEQQ